MIERVLVGVAALLVAAIAGLWFHSAHLETQAQRIAERPPATLPRAEVDRALSLFQRSRANNPDTRPIEREAGLLIRVGRQQEAINLLKPVVARQPQDLTAWVLLAFAAPRVDPALARTATARALALNPLGPRGS